VAKRAHGDGLTPASSRCLVALLAVLLAASLPPAQAAGGDAPAWTVDHDTVLAEGKTVAGQVWVTNNATLRLEGATLLVGERLLVTPGAKLVLAPRGGTPAALGPAPGSKTFWIEVNGTLEATGTPGATISGLAADMGSGMRSFLTGKGGLQVRGSADLEGATLQDSLGGLFIQARGSATLRDAAVRKPGEAGIMSYGRLVLERSNVTGATVFGVVGRDSCDLTVADSSIDSGSDTFLVSGCRASVRSTRILYGNGGLSVNGDANVTVQDSVVERYRNFGVLMKAFPDPSGVMERPSLRLLRTDLRPAKGALHGIQAEGAQLVDVEGSDISGHLVNGIEARTSRLKLADVALHGNGGYGLLLLRSQLLGSPIPDADFGSDAVTVNRRGAISQQVLAEASALDAQGTPVQGLHLRVEGSDGATVFEGDAGGNSTLSIRFEAYAAGPDGKPRFLGPFRYEATSPQIPSPITGTIDPAQGILQLREQDGGSGGIPWSAFAQFGLLFGGVGLVSYGLLSGPIRKLLRRRS
jgi:hypothetical protein